VLFAAHELSDVKTFIRPCLFASAFLLIILPVSLVRASVNVPINSVSMRSIIDPLAFINVSIRQDESASSVGFALVPPADVLAASFPNLCSSALSAVCNRIPLACKDSILLNLLVLFQNQLLELESGRQLVVQLIAFEIVRRALIVVKSSELQLSLLHSLGHFFIVNIVNIVRLVEKN
jgi:hypothetical protein